MTRVTIRLACHAGRTPFEYDLDYLIVYIEKNCKEKHKFFFMFQIDDKP